jgi:hypothetical protein
MLFEERVFNKKKRDKRVAIQTTRPEKGTPYPIFELDLLFKTVVIAGPSFMRLL